jgi:hypothetical protein
MNLNEVGFEAWVLIGNVLNLLLRGYSWEPNAATPSRVTLARLEDTLKPLQPSQMLASLQAMPSEDRLSLLQACEFAFALAGTEAQTVLGLQAEEASPVLSLLNTA